MTVIEVDLGTNSSLVVERLPVGSIANSAAAYIVKVDGVVRHPDCSAEDVIRALGHYLHSTSFKLKKGSADSNSGRPPIL